MHNPVYTDICVCNNANSPAGCPGHVRTAPAQTERALQCRPAAAAAMPRVYPRTRALLCT